MQIRHGFTAMLSLQFRSFVPISTNSARCRVPGHVTPMMRRVSDCPAIEHNWFKRRGVPVTAGFLYVVITALWLTLLRFHVQLATELYVIQLIRHTAQCFWPQSGCHGVMEQTAFRSELLATNWLLLRKALADDPLNTACDYRNTELRHWLTQQPAWCFVLFAAYPFLCTSHIVKNYCSQVWTLYSVRPVFLKHDVSETGFCPRLQVEPT
jgi:hypothetical protein